MKKKNGLGYVWKKNGAWIDANWYKLEALCHEESEVRGVEKPYVTGELFEVRSNEVIFRVRSNSQYVFQYIMSQAIKKDIKKRK